MIRQKYAIWILLCVVILVGFWLRVENLDIYPPGISNDEAVNTIDAFHFVRTGNFPLYQDRGRPDPLFRFVQAAGSATYGNLIWAFRLTSAFFGTLTIAAAYFAAFQCLHDVPIQTRRIATLSAAIVIAVAVGHIAVTRSTYRAVPQPLFMFLATGFLMRGLRFNRWRDFVWSGVWVAAGLYTYTAAFMVPAAFFPLGLHLLIQRWKTVKTWLPRFIMVGVTTAILCLPIAYVLISTPEALTGRASTVSESSDEIPRQIRGVVEQLYSKGDENPQYNVAQAPLFPRSFAPLFTLGLIALLIRFRQPSSTFIFSLLIVSALPVVLADELSHGLRIIGEYAVFPLVMAAAVASIIRFAIWLTQRAVREPPLQVIHLMVVSILTIGFMWEAMATRSLYAHYWTKPNDWQLWSIHGLTLDHNEWFFRTDRRDFAEWIVEQETPLLIPISELAKPTTRSWLFDAYPQVIALSMNDVDIPSETQIVAPWSLEEGDILRDEKQYALLENGTIAILPPFSDGTHTQLTEDIENGEVITRDGVEITFLGYVNPLPQDVEITFEPPVEQTTLASFTGDEIKLVDWRGQNTLTEADFNRMLTYHLSWSASRQIGVEYWSYLQLQTQDYQRITGTDQLIWRWIFPTSIWQPSDIVSVPYELEMPEMLDSGAYRLVTGLYPTNGQAAFVDSSIYGNLEDAVTVGWIKVPQAEQPTPSNAAIKIDAEVGEIFQLSHFEVEAISEDQVLVKLYWNGLIDRPNIDATVFVHGLNQQGIIITQSDIRPANGQYPTFIWDEGEIVMTEHILSIAEDDDLVLIAGMYTQPDFTRLDVLQDGEIQASQAVSLGELQSYLD